MDGTTLVSRHLRMIEADLAGEPVGLHVKRGICYCFNATTTRAWHLIEEPRTVDALADLLVAEYEVGKAECRAELVELLDELEREDLARLDLA